MKAKVLVQGSKEALFAALVDEQLKYFQRFLPELTELVPGVGVDTKLPTKLNNVPVSARLEVVEVTAPDRYVQATVSADDRIEQIYQLEDAGNGVMLSYEEVHHFAKNVQQASYGITGLFYKFMFNRQCKKRARYLEAKIAQQD